MNSMAELQSRMSEMMRSVLAYTLQVTVKVVILLLLSYPRFKRKQWWSTEPMLLTTRKAKGFRDGVSEKGNSLLDDLPELGLSACFDELVREQPDKPDTSSFIHTPSKHESVESFVKAVATTVSMCDLIAATKEVKDEWTKTSTEHSGWNLQVENDGGPLSSPGRYPEDMRAIRQGNLAVTVDQGRREMTNRSNVKLASPETRERVKVEAKVTGSKSSIGLANDRSGEAQLGGSSGFQSLVSLFTSIVSGETKTTPVSNGGPARGPPGDDEPSDN